MRLLPLLGAALVLAPPAFVHAADPYVVGADSRPQPGVPAGELIRFEFAGSTVFPGTTREVIVYVPHQYDPARPACLYVNQDGLQWHANVVFDNLIARGELPVIVGVFVRPGVVRALDPAAALDRFNRSVEYDGLGDAYARFLVEELLPAVETRVTRDGRPIRLSRSANDRAIGGSSSGAIAAFTAAWERPDAFSRVFSAIGTYVDLRGGGHYPTLIRKFEPKPIRVFLQDGAHDNNRNGGDWWMANQMMERALVFAGYEVTHVWGEGSHSGRHADALFPDAMRWLWHAWPQPVKGSATRNDVLEALLIPGEDWQPVGDGYRETTGAAANARGEVFFNDVAAGQAYRAGRDGLVTLIPSDAQPAEAQAFDAEGRLLTASRRDSRVRRHESDGRITVLAEGLAGRDLVVGHNGNAYVVEPAGTAEPPGRPVNPSSASTRRAGKVWLLRPGRAPSVVDTGIRTASGVCFSTDQSLLYVADRGAHGVYSFQIRADGTLAHRQLFYWLHEADPVNRSEADGLCVDRSGRLYVATQLGVQVCDQAGKVQCILPTPNQRVSRVVFGGERFDTLYATCGDQVYRRKLKTTGANAWDRPVKPPPPRL